MDLTKQFFGLTEKGEEADLFTLTNNNSMQVRITNYGGIITDILVPDKVGKTENVVLGFDKLDDYFSESYKKSMPYFGAIVGRYANRINKGKFEIDGTVYQIPCNLGDFSLHGGITGFDKKMWKTKTIEKKENITLELTYLSKDMEEGFPGNMRIVVSYTLTNKNELRIDYQATSDKKTHHNLTDHSYFNLSGFKEDILSTETVINADTFTEVDKNSIPTGRFTNVVESCMDFRKPHIIGERIEEAQGNGYDHNYVINGFDGQLQLAASAFDPLSGRKLEVLTTEPGVQFYTSNYMDGSLKRGDTVFSSRMGFCFETQHFPDSPNQPGFPSTLLEPGNVFNSTTIYKFPTIKI